MRIELKTRRSTQGMVSGPGCLRVNLKNESKRGPKVKAGIAGGEFRAQRPALEMELAGAFWKVEARGQCLAGAMPHAGFEVPQARHLVGLTTELTLLPQAGRLAKVEVDDDF